MASTYTSNLNIVKPAQGDQVNAWGPTVNDNMDLIDTAVTANLPKAGGTMTGDLSLNDGIKAKFGTGNDFTVEFDGNYANLKSVGTEPIRILTDNFIVMNKAGSANVMNMPTANAGIDFSYNGTKKFGVESYGIDVVGNVQVSGTVDGVDVATRDGVLTSTTTTANAALPKAGGTMTGDIAHASSFATKPLQEEE